MQNPEYIEPTAPKESATIPGGVIVAGILIGLAFIVVPKWETYKMERLWASRYCTERGQTETDFISGFNTGRDDIKTFDRVWFCKPSYEDVPALGGGSK